MSLKKRNVANIDLDTGEILPGALTLSRQKFYIYPEGFTMNSRFGSKFVARDKELTGVAHRVLRELESELEYENWVPVALVDIAEALGIKHEQVSRAVKVLVKKGIIFRGKKIGRSYVYRLNPEYCWRGDARNQIGTIYEIPSSEYTEARREYLIQLAEERKVKKGLKRLKSIEGQKKIINITQEVERRKKAQELAEKIISSDVDLEKIEELINKSGTR